MATKINSLDKNLSLNARQVFIEFSKSPHSNVFFKNKKGLIYFSETLTFTSSKWNYNPIQFCQDYYQEQYLHPIILLVNNLPSMYNFNTRALNNKFLAPKIDYIMKLLSYELEEYNIERNQVTSDSLNIYNPDRYRE